MEKVFINSSPDFRFDFLKTMNTGPEVITFLCSIELSMKFIKCWHDNIYTHW